MAYRHITSCIPLGQQKNKQELMVQYGVPLGIIGAVIAGIATRGLLGAAAGFAGTIPLAIVLGFCDWWFHYRLICIEDDQCAIGTVGLTEVSRGIDDPDQDYTINLVLAPILRDSNLTAAQQLPLLLPASGFRRYFTPQSKVINGQSVPYPPLNGIDKIKTVEDEDQPSTTALHCEIEGDGMKTVCAAATVSGVVGAVGGAAAGAAAAAGCAATGIFFLLCLLVAVVVAALASAVATGAGWVVGVIIGGSDGSPQDVALNPESGRLEAGDHIVIMGDWIYDNAHEGWHELHPVKSLAKLHCPTTVNVTTIPGADPEYPDSPESKRAIEKVCLQYLADRANDICWLLKQGRDPTVQGAQNEPRNNWDAHPRLG